MPQKTPGPRMSLDRIGGAISLPVVTVPAVGSIAEERQQRIGALLQLDVAGLRDQALRNASQANRELREGWEMDAPLAYHSRVVRCAVLQAIKRAFAASSDAVRGQNVISGLEQGTGSHRVYAQALPDWRGMCLRLQDRPLFHIARGSIGRLADALVPDDEHGTVIGVLRKLALRHGRASFDAHSGLSYGNLDVRKRTGMLGTCDVNVAAVLAMIRLEGAEDAAFEPPRDPDETPVASTIASLWEHPHFEEFRKAWMADVEGQLRLEGRVHDAAALLAERLKMYAALPGLKQHESALRTHYKIPAMQARALAGNKFHDVDAAVIDTILARLVDERHLPEAERDAFLREAAQLRETSAAPEGFGKRVAAALQRRDMTYDALTLAIDPRSRRPDEASPVSLVRDSIVHGRVNDVVSMHAVCSLAADTSEEADALLSAFADEYKHRPKVGAKRLTTAHLFMVEGALTPADLPPPFTGAVVPEEEGGDQPRVPDGMVPVILQTMWGKTAQVVERWNDFQAPRTVRAAFADLRTKVGAARLLARVEISNKSTMPRILEGTEIPCLPSLRTVVADGDGLLTHDLLFDWYQSRAALNASNGMGHLASALETLSMADATSPSAYATAKTTSTTLADNTRKSITTVIRGQALSPERFASLVRNLQLEGTPTGMYLHALHASPDIGSALNAWMRALVAADNMGLVRTVLDVRHRLLQPPAVAPSPLDRLRAAMERKRHIHALRSAQPPCPDEPALLSVLRQAPGLRAADLLAWTPDIAGTSTTHVAQRPMRRDAVDDDVVEVAESPADAAYAGMLRRLLDEYVPQEFAPYFDDFVQKINLRAVFDYQWKAKQGDGEKVYAVLSTTVRLRLVREMR